MTRAKRQLPERQPDPTGEDTPTVCLALDEYGSPVPLEAGSWFVCFVPGLQKQWWHPFVHRIHKHDLKPWWTKDHGSRGARRRCVI